MIGRPTSDVPSRDALINGIELLEPKRCYFWCVPSVVRTWGLVQHKQGSASPVLREEAADYGEDATIFQVANSNFAKRKALTVFKFTIQLHSFRTRQVRGVEFGDDHQRRLEAYVRWPALGGNTKILWVGIGAVEDDGSLGWPSI